MPAEAHRFTHRLGARDRRFLAVFACAALLGAIAVGLLLQGHNETLTPPGGHCVVEARASIMGGANYTYCGKKADFECAHPATTSSSFAEQCRRIGD